MKAALEIDGSVELGEFRLFRSDSALQGDRCHHPQKVPRIEKEYRTQIRKDISMFGIQDSTGVILAKFGDVDSWTLRNAAKFRSDFSPARKAWMRELADRLDASGYSALDRVPAFLLDAFLA